MERSMGFSWRLGGFALEGDHINTEFAEVSWFLCRLCFQVRRTCGDKPQPPDLPSTVPQCPQSNQ